MYSTCIQCFNKKVRCEFCNKELNKSYLRSHVKKQHLYQHYNRAASQDDKREASHTTTQLCDSSRTNINTGGDLLPTRQLSRQLPQLRESCRDSFRTHLPTKLPTQLHTKVNNDDNNNNDNNIDDNNKCNRTLIIGPSFCGKTHLLLNKLRLIRLEDPEKQIRIITRSPEQ